MTAENGDVWWCEHPEIGRRPVVVLSRSRALRARRRAVVAPCTTTMRGLPSEVELDPRDDPVPQPCVVSLDSVEGIPTAMLIERLGALSGARMREICEALAIAVDCR
ncbi:MAG TPA: type II toxin-antitoxin system PemK/MazF family toxin [Phycicoccus sp.]|jgi:mRNA interferase MazF|nr:type II toxin-antitoxin system PemK/MazF family toxin [Phycicoccus sp.]HQH06201.1 type II toxin-antitoxin system PemK/MazF family toxin [Phycicoccus sp.]HQK30258.1 type II toxin-antitoxin system PemK/MazF family toxin [Phycicoccus sp.]HQV91047.1 type II toxin-antitoxin system PemK/MazF family toxin [Phycicoccus sp.]HQY95653.1 type II toxin-antitoxin system PemK/MazF family toxin [Phycicoccus sp.]